MKFRSFENKAFIVLLVLVTAAFAWVIRGFLMPIFWAAVLAVLFTPMFNRLRRLFRGRGSIASSITLVAVLLVVFVPLVLIGAAVTNEAVGLYARVSSGELDLSEPIASAERLLPELTRRATNAGVDLNKLRDTVSDYALTGSRLVASQLLNLGGQALQFTLLIAVTLYLLFFFLRDGERLVELLIRALPLGDTRERALLRRFGTVTRATVKGSFLVAVAQGFIGGVVFLLLGLGSPILWGVMMGVVSFIPAVGSFIIWGPAAIYLILTGSVAKGIILIVVGMLIIGMVDNLLRPILVGRDAGMPDYLILLATLGGLAAFGISGLIVGPVVAGLFLTVWDIFATEFSEAEELLKQAATVEQGVDPDSHVAVSPHSELAANGTADGVVAGPLLEASAETDADQTP